MGEEGYTENVAETQVLCSCQKTGIMIIRKAGSDEKSSIFSDATIKTRKGETTEESPPGFGPGSSPLVVFHPHLLGKSASTRLMAESSPCKPAAAGWELLRRQYDAVFRVGRRFRHNGSGTNRSCRRSGGGGDVLSTGDKIRVVFTEDGDGVRFSKAAGQEGKYYYDISLIIKDPHQ